MEAKAVGNPTKDQMRLMMQSLLAERFQLQVHFETHETPVFFLSLARSEKPGPMLKRHEDGPACDGIATPGKSGWPGKDDVFPARCDSMALIRKPGVAMSGARNVTVAYFADALPSLGEVERAVVDQTGLSGKFDFRIEWTPERTASLAPNAALIPADPLGPAFLDALREQLGLKLTAGRAPLQRLVVDRVATASEN
jgi:uncharacterized protein (TIGR03435 family)